MDDASPGPSCPTLVPVDLVSRFHVHARLFRGTLLAPERNELQSRETDDHGEAVALGDELAALGFRVWLYSHEHTDGPTLPSGGYRVIREW